MEKLPPRLRIPPELISDIAGHLCEWDAVKLIYIMPASINAHNVKKLLENITVEHYIRDTSMVPIETWDLLTSLLHFTKTSICIKSIFIGKDHYHDIRDVARYRANERLARYVSVIARRASTLQFFTYMPKFTSKNTKFALPFRLEVLQADCGTLSHRAFSNLKQLNVRINTADELDWALSQVSSLTFLGLHTTNRIALQYPEHTNHASLLSKTLLTVSISGFDLTNWPPLEMSSLTILRLEDGPGAHSMLARSFAGHFRRSSSGGTQLVHKIVTDRGLTEAEWKGYKLQSRLSHLPLKELHLVFEGQKLDCRVVLPRLPGLQTLKLDYGKVRDHPATSEVLQIITAKFPILQSLTLRVLSFLMNSSVGRQLKKPLDSSLKHLRVLGLEYMNSTLRLENMAERLSWGFVRPNQPLEIRFGMHAWQATRKSYDMKLPPDLLVLEST
jgi:hypothetical protein